MVVGTHPNPTTFPDGLIFGNRRQNPFRKHHINGMSVESFQKYPTCLLKCLHEYVVEEDDVGQFSQVLLVKDKTKRKKVEKRVKERTQIEGVRNLIDLRQSCVPLPWTRSLSIRETEK